jgi:hypothetical protein
LRRVVERLAVDFRAEDFRAVLFRVIAMGHPLSLVQCGRWCDVRSSLGFGVDDNL